METAESSIKREALTSQRSSLEAIVPFPSTQERQLTGRVVRESAVSVYRNLARGGFFGFIPVVLSPAKRRCVRTINRPGALHFRMQPAKAPCKSQEALESRLHADIRVYTEAIRRLEAAAARGTANEHAFKKALRDVRVARDAFTEARRRLNRHIASHGCG